MLYPVASSRGYVLVAGQLYIWIVHSFVGMGQAYVERVIGCWSVKLTTCLRLQEFLAGRMRDVS